MREKDPLEPLLDQIAELLKKIQDYKDPIPDIPPHILEQLNRLEQAMAMFHQLNQTVSNVSGIDTNALKMDAQHFKMQTPKNKQILDRARHLETDARKIHTSLTQILAHKQTSRSPQLADKNKKRQLRKRFRTLGDKGWIPL